MGLLIQSASRGDTDHASSSSAAMGSACGLNSPTSAASPSASNGTPRICLQSVPILDSRPNRRMVCAEVVHCRSRLRLTVRRTSVLPMASTISRAS